MLIDGYTLFGTWPGLPHGHTVDDLIQGIERHSLDRACTLSTQGIFFDAATGNATTWAACQQDERLIPIGVADPRVNGIEQVEYCQQQGFRLIALYPVTQEWSIAGLSGRQVLQRIAETNLTVMIEAHREGDATAILNATQGLSMPIILLSVSLPTLTEAIAVLQQRPQTYLSTRLLCGGDTIEYLVNSLGADRLIFASRFPISCFSSAFLTAKFAEINDESRAAILGGNMEKMLGIA